MKRFAAKEQSVGAFEAKTKLSRYLADAERGIVTVVTKRGKPAAKIVPADAEVLPKKEASDLEGLLHRARALRAKTRRRRAASSGSHNADAADLFRDDDRATSFGATWELLLRARLATVLQLREQ